MLTPSTKICSLCEEEDQALLASIPSKLVPLCRSIRIYSQHYTYDSTT